MKSPTLYDLSKPQLEAVVAQVIREEGFVKLVCADPINVALRINRPFACLQLENLDSMWKLKGFVPNPDS